MSAIPEKVRKLLAKAESPACTPEEAAALTAKAAELIAKYGVDRALLAADAPDTDPVGDLVIECPAPYARDKADLLAGVGAVLRCQSVRRHGLVDGRHAFAIHLFGHGSDLERVELLYTSLLVQAAHGLAAAPLPAWENPAAFRRSWLAGFRQAVCWRLREAEERAVGEPSPGPSVALVLADRSSAVGEALMTAYPRLRFSGPRQLAGSGRAVGYAAGQRANLASPVALDH